MVPGDIYIGKATLIQYRIVPHDSEFGIDSYMEHIECGNEVDTDSEDFYMNPWDYLNAVLAHEKECPKKCKTVASPAEDSSTTNAPVQPEADAAADLEKQSNRHSSQSRGNPYAKTQEVMEFVERAQTVKPNPNVL